VEVRVYSGEVEFAGRRGGPGAVLVAAARPP
jgi:hypothetical protein